MLAPPFKWFVCSLRQLSCNPADLPAVWMCCFRCIATCNVSAICCLLLQWRIAPSSGIRQSGMWCVCVLAVRDRGIAAEPCLSLWWGWGRGGAGVGWFHIATPTLYTHACILSTEALPWCASCWLGDYLMMIKCDCLIFEHWLIFYCPICKTIYTFSYVWPLLS